MDQLQKQLNLGKKKIQKSSSVDILATFQLPEKPKKKVDKQPLEKKKQLDHEYIRNDKVPSKPSYNKYMIGVSNMTPEQIRYKQNVEKAQEQKRKNRQAKAMIPGPKFLNGKRVYGPQIVNMETYGLQNKQQEQQQKQKPIKQYQNNNQVKEKNKSKPPKQPKKQKQEKLYQRQELRKMQNMRQNKKMKKQKYQNQMIQQKQQKQKQRQKEKHINKQSLRMRQKKQDQKQSQRKSKRQQQKRQRSRDKKQQRHDKRKKNKLSSSSQSSSSSSNEYQIPQIDDISGQEWRKELLEIAKDANKNRYKKLITQLEEKVKQQQ